MTLLDIRPKADWDRLITTTQAAVREHDGGKTWQHVKADGSTIDVLVYRQSLPYDGRNGTLAASPINVLP